MISGTDNSPLAGVMIYVEGTTAGTITNGDGSYTFTIPAKSKYVTFSYVGFDTKKLHVEDTELFKLVSLAEQSNALDEVVVIGYGTQKKESMVASITSVKPSDLNITSSSLTTAFAGNIAGMISRQTSGEPGYDSASFYIRGISTFGSSNAPLIILDGAEISMEELYDLDMYEIERIDVLKDAQASIVYGDRAANGVIVIERQQVTDSKPRLSYNFVPELSIPDLSSMNLCNAAQKLELERQAGLYESDNGAMDKAYAYKLQNVRRGVNTDWIRAPLRVPFSHTHSLSLSGRAQKIDYRASLRFSDKYGVMKGDNRRNYTLNFSIGYHMRDKLTLRYTANYTLTDATDSPYGKFSPYTKLNPYESPYDEYGELVKAFYFDPEDTSTTSEGYQANPLYNATLSSFSTSRNQTLRNTVDAKWYVTKDFYVSGQFNIDVKSSQSDKYVSPDDAQFLGENDPAKRGLYGLGTGKAFNYDGKIVLNYGRNIGQEGSGFVINAGSDIQHTNATTSYICLLYTSPSPRD